MLAPKQSPVLIDNCKLGSSKVIERVYTGTSKQDTQPQCGMQRALLSGACAARSQHPQGQMYRCTWLYTLKKKVGSWQISVQQFSSNQLFSSACIPRGTWSTRG